MITDRVLIVLNNYSRPENMPKIIDAWKNQSVLGNHIVVTDNRPVYRESEGAMELYPNEILKGVNDVWRWKENSGCPCHFYPALAYPQFQYTIFADDDLIPGKHCVENLLKCAKELNNKFSTLGQTGRVFDIKSQNGQRYTTKNQPHRQLGRFTPVDITCRAHMVCTHRLPSLFFFRNELVAFKKEEGYKLATKHDDFLLCIGMQKIHNHPSYLVPISASEAELIKQDLDDKKALWKNTGHFEERNRMVDLSIELSWASLVPQSNKGN